MKKTIYENGKAISVDITSEEIENLPKISCNYDQLVEEFIREKYTLGDELAISNNRMAVFDANLLPKDKEEEYNREYYAYQIYREECKKRAREICGIAK